MKTGSRSNALLTEVLIVVMFFLLTSTVLLQVFAAARTQSARAEAISAAVEAAQNVADRMYSGEDAEKVLTEMGFTGGAEGWTRDDGAFTLEVRLDTEEAAEGAMLRRSVRALNTDGELLLTLPCSKWTEATP